MASTQTQNGNPPASAEGQGHAARNTALGVAALSLLPKPPGPVAGALTVTQIATASTALLTALKRFQYQRAQAFDDQLRKEALGVAPTLSDVVDNVISRELGFEATFRQKQYERVMAALGPALSIADKAKREAAVRAIFERERRYTKMREQAMRVRVLAAIRHHHLEQASPQGAYWILGQGVKQHTLDAVAPWTVVGGPPIRAAARRWYEGELVEIEVEGGARLAVSPKHPMLTLEGWVAAGLVHEGDHLLRHSGAQPLVASADDEADVPASVEQVYRALAESGVLPRVVVPVGPEDFHGDGQDGEVEIVGTDRALEDWLVSVGAQRVCEPAFVGGDEGVEPFLGQRGAAAGLVAVLAVGTDASEGNASVLEDRCDASPVDPGAACDRQGGFAIGVGADYVIRLDRRSFDAVATQEPSEGVRADATLARKLLGGAAGAVTSDQILRVRRRPYSGHVYDLQTEGWYTAEHYIVGNCLAMANHAWPWVVLHAFQPPVHHGCACSLLSIHEAVSSGLMRPSQVPDEAAALRLATERLQTAAEAMRSKGLQEGDVDRYLEGLALEEAWTERFSAGTTHGGEFRPKVGGDPGARLLKKLGLGRRGEVMHKLMPSRQPLALDDRGQWQWVNGRQYRVPLHDDWRQRVGGEVYHSPAGTTNVYKGGALLSLPALSGEQRTGIRDQIKALVNQARSRAASRREPLRAGDGPEHVLAMDERGFVPNRVSPHGAGAWKITYHHEGTSSEVHAVVGKDGKVKQAHWQTPEIPDQYPRIAAGAPRSVRQHTADAVAWAHELGRKYGSTVRIRDVTVSHTLEDHAGFHEHSGRTHLGIDVQRDIERASQARKEGRELTDDERRGVWASYQTTAHEIGHGVNPMHPEDYHGEQANLEEALTEETAHPLAAARLAAQGQSDVLEWRAANPNDVPVKGVYRRQRGALADVLDRAGVSDPHERADVIHALKFQVDPKQRFRVLGAMIANHEGGSMADHEDWARRKLRKGSKARGAIPQSPGFEDFGKWSKKLKPKATGLAADQKLFDTPGGGKTGHAKPKPPPVVFGGDVAKPAMQGPIPSFRHIPLAVGGKAFGWGRRALKASRGREDWIVKEYHGDKQHVASELLANAVYRTLGVNVPLMGHVQTPGAPDFSQVPDAINESPVDAPPGTRVSAGVILRDKKGRVTLIEPRNHYGGYTHTFPKGGQETGLTTQQTALKELWEETGLHGHITGVVGDFKGDTGVTRYYVGVLTGGEPTPSDETEAIKTVPIKEAAEMLNRERDQSVLKAVAAMPIPKGKFKDDFPPVVPGSAVAFRAPGGKPNAPKEPSAPLGAGYMADALLGNWAIVGDRGDNLRWNAAGEPIRVNHESAFEYRPSGEGKEYGSVPHEVWSMLHRGDGRHVALTEDEMRAQAKHVGDTMTDAKIDQLVDAAPFPTAEARDGIRKALHARVRWMREFGAGEVDLPLPAEGAEARALHADHQRKFQLYPEEDQAIADYLGEKGRAFDKGAAEKSEPTDDSRRIAKHLDNVLNDAKTPADSVAYIGHEGDIGRSIVGQTVRQGSYTLAHTDRAAAGGANAIRVLLPGGSHAFHLTDAGPGAPDMLIHRGARMRFSALKTAPDGSKVADAVLLPYARPSALPGGKSSWSGKPMGQTKIAGGSKPPGIPAGFSRGDKVVLNGMEGEVKGHDGHGKLGVKMKDGGKLYYVPPESVTKLEEALVELIEAEQTHTGVMVALHPHPSTQKKLALPGGEDPSEIHVTLAYLGKQDEIEDPDKLKATVADWASRTPPLEGEVSGHGLFTAGDEPVTYLSPDLPGLPAARQDLVDSLEKAGLPASKQHGFTPHMTLAYKDRTKDVPDHGGHKLRFSKASLVIGPEKHSFKFTGQPRSRS